MHIPVMYSQRDITAIEDQVLNLLTLSGQEIKVNKSHHYLEPVGKYLWETWNKSQAQHDKDQFITYMLPLIAHLIKPHIRFLNQNLNYEDLFQLCVIHLMEHIGKYNPERINKTGTTSKVFTYFTLIIQYYIKTITSKNWNHSNKHTSYHDIIVGSGTDGYRIFVEFIDFLDVLRDRKNIRDSHRLIFDTLYYMLTEEQDLHMISTNLLSTIANKTGIKRDNENILSAFRLLRTAYGPLQFDNVSYFLSLHDQELES